MAAVGASDGKADQHSRRAVFLDLNGTLIEPVRPQRLVEHTVIPGTAAARQLLEQHGFLCPIITVQSGVARGRFSLTSRLTRSYTRRQAGPRSSDERHGPDTPSPRRFRPTADVTFVTRFQLEALV